jgi:hypothetical protein
MRIVRDHARWSAGAVLMLALAAGSTATAVDTRAELRPESPRGA